MAKSGDFVTQELQNEVLIYNLQTNKALCLNSSVALVFKHCDGKTDFQQIINTFQKEQNIKIDIDFIWLTLDELSKAELLENYNLKFESKISRRRALLNYALPLALLPVIVGVTAPKAAQAASGAAVCAIDSALSCSTNADCGLVVFPPCAPGCNCGPVICFTGDSTSPSFNCCDRDEACN